MKLSIIIPIYNVENYIKKTLETVFFQNIDPCIIEYILINDGSTDDSMKIVNNFIKSNDIQVHIINQINQGLSCARNAGLQIAQGEYIWFIDSDDSIENNCIRPIIGYLNQYKADIFAFDLTCIYESNKQVKTSPLFYKKKDEKLYHKSLNKYELINKIRETPVQRFIYKRNFLAENKLFFLPGVFHEDNEFMVKALFYAEKIVPIPYAPYKYLIRKTGSITSNKSLKHIDDLFIIIKSLQTFQKQTIKSKKEKKIIDFYIFLLLHNILKNELYTEYKKIKSVNKVFLKKIITNGLKASLKFSLWPSSIKSIMDLLKI